MTVYCVFVVIVHGFAVPLTKHDVLPKNVESWTICNRVKIYKNEPAYVVNRGVTENDILLVVVCIAVILFVYPPEPVNNEMKFYGVADTVPDVAAYIIGALAVKWASVSILT